MKRFLSLFAASACIVALAASCVKIINEGGADGGRTGSDKGGDDEQSGQTFQIDRSKIYGTWQVVKAKFAEDAVMSDWPYEDTYATFKENGIYEGEGYYGKGTGSYSIKDDIISVLIDGQPYVDYAVSEQKDSSATMCAKFRSNGVKVWMECKKVTDSGTLPTDIVTDDEIFQSESNLKAATLGVYKSATEFAKYQFEIEQTIIKGNSSSITPQTSQVQKLWSAGYTVLSRANLCINGINSVSGSHPEFKEKYLPHFLALRAYAYYNMAMLWGDIPFVTESNIEEAKLGLPRTSKSVVYAKAIEDLSSITTEVVDFANLGVNIFSNASINLLLAELYLTVGNNTLAKSRAGDVSGTSAQPVLSFVESVNEQESNAFVVYIGAHSSLFIEEADGNTATLLDDWKKAEFADFGYWAMLKRIGKAQHECGCSDYRLLLPIPHSEIIMNSKLTQNPGYDGNVPEPVPETAILCLRISDGGDTKSSLEPTAPRTIQDGDNVWVNGKVYQAKNSTVEVEPAESYIVYYGLSSLDIGTEVNCSILEFPEYLEEYPDIPYGAVSNSTTIDLKILTSLFKVTLTTDLDIDRVILTAPDESTKISGYMAFSLPDMTYSGCRKGNNMIKAKNFKGENVFYFSIPPMTLPVDTKVDVYDKQENLVRSVKTTKPITLQRAKITSINVKVGDE